ncbi:hypothetical protein BOTBODRAFT_56933 [Botryobasidium botryosum FD-172 SS1]|uniref:Bacteriophage T5 Orf172 DNA-binding domain-containing protein n=1 Tax=Botryobasidium botryosum (strain FD-172 SS1) TaxID=930990 RepID=A0A067MKJ5_BOTB1|nr:hypothetical protein BOTBODRAFT_56933 [Botryobasidium botryosum FD-172 SS1]
MSGKSISNVDSELSAEFRKMTTSDTSGDDTSKPKKRRGSERYNFRALEPGPRKHRYSDGGAILKADSTSSDTRRERSLSEPPSPTSTALKPSSLGGLCAGRNLDGRPCRRIVRKSTSAAIPEGVGSLKRYCHDHGPTPPDTWETKDWIPQYLTAKAREDLDAAMHKLPDSDCAGYVYAFEILQDQQSGGEAGVAGSKLDEVTIKIGRTERSVNKRLSELKKHYHNPDTLVSLGWWPRTLEEERYQSKLLAMCTGGEKGKYNVLVERLVLLELEDLTATGIYRAPGFFDKGPPLTARERPLTPLPSPRTKAKCPSLYCDMEHREHFTFYQFRGGDSRALGLQVWELIIYPIMKKWGKWVEEHAVPRDIKKFSKASD